MSRLDSFIRRLEAQRSCLNLAREALRDVEGPVLELGLGNGRTFDHLRELFPEREIFVFEQKVAAHPECIPDEQHLFLGDIYTTLPRAVARFGETIALVHSDAGSGIVEETRQLANFIAGQVSGLLTPGGLVVSDQEQQVKGTEAVRLPPGIRPRRYFIRQRPRR